MKLEFEVGKKYLAKRIIKPYTNCNLFWVETGETVEIEILRKGAVGTLIWTITKEWKTTKEATIVNSLREPIAVLDDWPMVWDKVVYVWNSLWNVWLIGKVLGLDGSRRLVHRMDWDRTTERTEHIKKIDLKKYELKVGDTVRTMTSTSSYNNNSGKDKWFEYVIAEASNQYGNIRYRQTKWKSNWVQASDLELVKIGKYTIEQTPTTAVAEDKKPFTINQPIKMTNEQTTVRKLLRDRYFKKEWEKVLTAIETAERISDDLDGMVEELEKVIGFMTTWRMVVRSTVKNIEQGVEDNEKSEVEKSLNTIKVLEKRMKSKEMVDLINTIEVLVSTYDELKEFKF